jgi:hypothetical protein
MAKADLSRVENAAAVLAVLELLSGTMHAKAAEEALKCGFSGQIGVDFSGEKRWRGKMCPKY